VSSFLESGKSDGATAIAGGGRYGNRGYFIEPTVLTNTRPDMKVVREEIFGPVVVAAPIRCRGPRSFEERKAPPGRRRAQPPAHWSH
jgi:Aldehyde dehydrogenase family